MVGGENGRTTLSGPRRAAGVTRLAECRVNGTVTTASRARVFIFRRPKGVRGRKAPLPEGVRAAFLDATLAPSSRRPLTTDTLPACRQWRPTSKEWSAPPIHPLRVLAVDRRAVRAATREGARPRGTAVGQAARCCTALHCAVRCAVRVKNRVTFVRRTGQKFVTVLLADSVQCSATAEGRRPLAGKWSTVAAKGDK